MTIFTETERLILREITMNDVEAMYELDSDPEVHKYLGNTPIKDLEQAAERIQIFRKQYDEDGLGRWAIVDKATNEFIGWTGFKLVREERNNLKNFYDLGFRLLRKFWGKGYATESALASLEYGFGKLDFKTVYAMAHIDNSGSNHVLKKSGFKFIETFYLEGDLHNWYKINKAKWRS